MFRHSQDGELAVGVSLDNRLRLYDATTGVIRQKYVEKDHLAFRYTCLDWLRGLAWNDKHPNKVVPGAKGGLGLLALGTDQGHVSLWDLTRGVLAARLGEGQNLKRITGLAFSPDGSKVYTASEGAAEVLEWDLKTKAVGRRITGDKHGASALALGANGGAGLLAVARTRIHLIDAASGERVKKISAGHAASVRCLAFSADGAFLATSAEGSRYVSIFDCRPGGGKKAGALATLALDGVPGQLGLRVEGGGVFTVLAVCDDGAVRVARQAPQEQPESEAPAMNGDGPAAPAGGKGATTLRVVKASSSGKKKLKKAADASGLAACLLLGEGQWRCALIHGTDAAPLFERFVYATGAGVEALLPQVAVAGLGDELGGADEVEKGSQKRKRGEGTVAVGVEDPASKKAAVDGSMGGAVAAASSQRTIGSRLGEMAAAAAATEGGAGVEVAGGGGKRAAPKADSLVTVLTQALKSSDEELLEQCLLVHDPTVVSNTVQLLPPQLTLALVETLVRKLEKRPNRAATICPWVRFLLLHHTSYLVSVPSLHKRLAGLHQLATRRVAALPRLLGLAGRLELMLSQISKQGDHHQAEGEEDGVMDVYDDNEGSEEEGGSEDEEGLAAEEDDDSQVDEEGMDEDEEDEDEEDEESA